MENNDLRLKFRHGHMDRTHMHTSTALCDENNMLYIALQATAHNRYGSSNYQPPIKLLALSAHDEANPCSQRS